MRLGLIARADNTGLGNQTWAFARHLDFERVLVVDMGHHGRTPVQRLERFGEPWAVLRDDELGPKVWAEFVKGLDAIYTAETPYEPGLIPIAQALGTRVIVHVNPEFYKPDWAHYDIVVLPSTWRANLIDHHAILPTPADLPEPHEATSALRWLHIGGTQATGDRNGTRLLRQVLGHVRHPAEFTVRSQRPMATGAWGARSRDVRVRTEVTDIASTEELYAGQDALVLPRRYGGQCLPMQEAAARGMAVVCLDRPPENAWGTEPAMAYRQPDLRLSTGQIDRWTASPAHIAQVVRRLSDPAEYAAATKKARAWAESISWDALREDWLHVFEGRPDLVRYRP